MRFVCAENVQVPLSLMQRAGRAALVNRSSLVLQIDSIQVAFDGFVTEYCARAAGLVERGLGICDLSGCLHCSNAS